MSPSISSVSSVSFESGVSEMHVRPVKDEYQRLREGMVVKERARFSDSEHAHQYAVG